MLLLRIYTTPRDAPGTRISNRLQTAHGHGELLRFWTADGGGRSYRIRPDLMLHRQPGAKIWHYSQSCQQLEDELLKQQSYEQQSGRASDSQAQSSWQAGRDEC